MDEFKVRTWLFALALALLPSVTGAAGLGRLTVLSSLGQPLVAEIDLVAVTPQELSSLSVRLAPLDAYRQANLQYNTALTGARLTIEKRASGQSYLKLETTRPVTEPFIDILVELTWAAGRLSREYTALLDPPGIPPAPPPAPMVSTVPEVRPAPAPEAAVPAPAPEPAVSAAPPAEPVVPEAAAPAQPVAPAPAQPVTPAPAAASKEYGPIERGETLGKIARGVMPEGVTLEQMLVALYRSNEDAFIRKNLNLVRTGKILRVPDREEVLAISQSEAVTEYRAQVADWNAYRQKLAEAAGTVPVEGRTAVSGKISTRAEDQAGPGTPKDVVKLSKGEPIGAGAADKGKPRTTAERIRTLEEELVAREKALAEANERIAQLEKTVKDMKRLVELKSPAMAAAQQPAAPPKPEIKPAPRPQPAQPEAKSPEAVASAKPEAAAPAPAPAKPAAPAPEAMKAAPSPKPAPTPKAPPPRPEPDLVDQILEAATDPLYLGAGGVVVIGGLAIWMVRRRRSRAGRDDRPPIAPTLSMAAAAAAGAAAATGDSAAAQPAFPAQAASAGEDVDPLQEADVYLQYGRDGQAEEILKEAVARDPRREDVQLKLLEIYAARKDTSAFGKLAAGFNKLTGGAGGSWVKAAAMGYALEPSNSLYAAGKDAAATMASGPGTASDIDLDLGAGGAATSTDITLDAGAPGAAAGTDTAILDLGAADKAAGQAASAAMPDFTLEVPPAGGATQTDIALEAAPAQAPAQETNLIDFQIELPKVSAEPPTIARQEAPTADGGLDFKLEVPNLDLGAKAGAEPAPAGGEKNGHWYDVQTKFDLAKAYQEMGDHAGAKEILQEVIKEGDAEQKAQAQALLGSLG